MIMLIDTLTHTGTWMRIMPPLVAIHMLKIILVKAITGAILKRVAIRPRVTTTIHGRMIIRPSSMTGSKRSMTGSKVIGPNNTSNSLVIRPCGPKWGMIIRLITAMVIDRGAAMQVGSMPILEMNHAGKGPWLQPKMRMVRAAIVQVARSPHITTTQRVNTAAVMIITLTLQDRREGVSRQLESLQQRLHAAPLHGNQFSQRLCSSGPSLDT